MRPRSGSCWNPAPRHIPRWYSGENLEASVLAQLERLRPQLRGNLITPESPDYDSARRIWNAMIDKRRAGIVGCAGVADVAATV